MKPGETWSKYQVDGDRGAGFPCDFIWDTEYVDGITNHGCDQHENHAGPHKCCSCNETHEQIRRTTKVEQAKTVRRKSE